MAAKPTPVRGKQFVDFFRWAVGKLLDWDAEYGFQCTDYIRYWIFNRGKRQLPSMSHGARYAFRDAPSDYWLKIKNSPTNHPLRGDIVVFGPPFGKVTRGRQTYYLGHIGVADDGCTSSKLVITHQNYGSYPEAVKRTVLSSFNGVIGWMRPRRGW